MTATVPDPPPIPRRADRRQLSRPQKENIMPAPHITVGVDGSEGGRRALQWALRHAAEVGAEVDAVTVFYYGSADPHHVPSHRAAGRRREAEQISRREVGAALAAHQAAPPPVNRYVVPAASTAPALRRAAVDSDLLVLGSHGHGALTSRLLGTVSMDCLRVAPCPVVIIPAVPTSTPVAREGALQVGPVG